MSYKYPSGEHVEIGDVVMHKKFTATIFRGGKRDIVPLRGEVVKSSIFTKEGGLGVMVIFHDDSMWGFHTYKTMHLPRRNGGYKCVDPKDLKFLHRGRPGESVFDPIPVHDETEDEE